MNNKPNKKETKEEGPNHNKQIKARVVLVIDENGQKLGEMLTRVALSMAQERGLDLVEVSANAEPPVCRFADFGKMLYEKKKKSAESKKKAATITIKEIKFTPSTGDNDFNVKAKQVYKFLEKGDKVKITIRFRGRELAHKEQGDILCKRLCDIIAPVGEVEAAPKMDGRQTMMMLAPKRSS